MKATLSLILTALLLLLPLEQLRAQVAQQDTTQTTQPSAVGLQQPAPVASAARLLRNSRLAPSALLFPSTALADRWDAQENQEDQKKRFSTRYVIAVVAIAVIIAVNVCGSEH